MEQRSQQSRGFQVLLACIAAAAVIVAALISRDVIVISGGGAQATATTTLVAEVLAPPTPTETPGDTSPGASVRYPWCPDDLQTVDDIIAKIGGDPGDWQVPQSWMGAWTMRSGDVEDLTYPGLGFFDSPAAMRVQADIRASEASFHCEDVPTT